MGIFGSGSPKPHRLYSNDQILLQEICAKAGYMSRDAQRQCEVKTTKRYIDNNGKRRCVGIKPALKESAYLSLSLYIFFFYCYVIVHVTWYVKTHLNVYCLDGMLLMYLSQALSSSLW